MGRIKDWLIQQQEDGLYFDEPGPETEPKPEPWDEYAVNASGNRYARMPFDTVAHVTHLLHATRIVEDRKLAARIVEDKGVLTSWRTKVVWFSPNDWTPKGGFRYGNIRFSVPFKNLIAGKNAYWLEAIQYRPAACRFLITAQDYSAHFRAYDPTTDLGPWILEGEQHYYNGNFCLEFVVESDVSSETVTQIDFVEHKKDQCCLRDVVCEEKGSPATDGGAMFLMMLMERNLSVRQPGFVRSQGNDEIPSAPVYLAISRLRGLLRDYKIAGGGSLTAEHPGSVAVIRAVLVTSNDTDRQHLTDMFVDNDQMVLAFDRAMAEALGLKDPRLLYRY